MSNVVALFQEEKLPMTPRGADLTEVMAVYEDWAIKQGINTNTPKFLHESAMLMTLMLASVGNNV